MSLKVILVLTLFISSCTVSNIVGTYSRTYKFSTPVAASIKKQKLIIASDSSFVLIDYQDEYAAGDSSIIYGIVRPKGKKLYNLIETGSSNKFCLFKKGVKLYFYSCDYGKRYRYPNPFVRISQ